MGLKESVAVVLVGPDNSRLLIEQAQTREWKFTQGTIEAGERPVDTAIRELGEEVGIANDDLYGFQATDVTHSYLWPQDLQEKLGFEGTHLQFVVGYSRTKRLCLDLSEVSDAEWVFHNGVFRKLHFRTYAGKYREICHRYKLP